MSMIGNFRTATDAELLALWANPARIHAVLSDEKPAVAVDIDKAWHGLHFLFTDDPLTGDAWVSDSILGLSILGGKLIGEEDVGYGAAMGVRSDQVRLIAKALTVITVEDLREKFVPAAFEAAGIYPGIWDEGDRAFDYLMEHFATLRAFYAEAAARGLGVITYLS